jgi:hypothetical protein
VRCGLGKKNHLVHIVLLVVEKLEKDQSFTAKTNGRVLINCIVYVKIIVRVLILKRIMLQLKFIKMRSG